MKANAPERIWIEPATDLTKLSGHVDNDNVEYIRKDVFIEKAEKWLNEHILDYVYAKEWGQGVGVEVELFDDFKEYMKGE